MRKMLFAVMLIAVLTFSACAVPQVSSSGFVSSISAPSAALSEADVEIVKGMSLDKIGYMCEPPLDVKIRDDILLDRWSDTASHAQWVDRLVGEGSTTLLSVYFYGPHSLGMESLNFMCLQAFYYEETQGTKHVRIGDRTYSFSELEQNRVYKTDDICVYDIYPLLNGEDLQALVIKQIDIHNSMVKKCVAATAEERKKYSIIMTEKDYVSYEDYDYLYDIAEYYKENIAKIITKNTKQLVSQTCE